MQFKTLLTVALLSVLGLAGCSGETSGNIQTSDSQNLQHAAPMDLSLASPAELEALLDIPREASYAEEDLIHHGKDYDHDLPSSRVSAVGDAVNLQAEWEPASSPTGMAYCIYSFNAADYDRENLLQYEWQVGPTDESLFYVGLANWDSDAWDWYGYDGDNNVNLDLMGSYISSSDVVLAAVVHIANNDDCTLRWIRLGEMPPTTAQLDTSAGEGVAPVVLTLAGFNSDPGVGEIVNYEWDYDGDGTYDNDGLINFDVHSYEAAGEYSPGMRITTEYGVQATDSDDLTVVDSWVHSIGMNRNEWFNAVATDGTAIYCAGVADTIDFDEEGLVAKYSLDGMFIWARATGFEFTDQLEQIVTHPNGDIFTMGRTQSHGSTYYNLLLQRWNDDGTIDWTRVYSPDYNDSLLHYWTDMAVYGEYLYAVGNFGQDPEYDAMIVCFDLDGNLQWAKRFGLSADQMTRSVTVTELSGQPEIHVCCMSGMAGGSSGPMYCRFSVAGNLREATGFEADNTVNPAAMLVSANPPGVFFTGYYKNSLDKQNIFLLKLEEPGPATMKTWSKSQSENADGHFILAEGGLLLIGGNAFGFDESPNQQRPLLVRTTTSGTALGMKHFGADVTRVISNDGCNVLDAGLLMVGMIRDEFAGQWTSGSLASWSVPGNWSALTVTVTNIEGTVNAPEASLTYLTAANHDSPDLSGDGLVVLTAAP